ncbi:Hypothetical protein FKW44_012843 [Caligus rogercresseyi]|uniref:Uncharacterized protein n=1 Tax=Caligus rogercresseyi TaxID=217165 RepID=A0A7T8HKJ3_CALRO|nr:Hypothetical protein FKW44_012843 [Caligus rogercresseyi]
MRLCSHRKSGKQSTEDHENSANATAKEKVTREKPTTPITVTSLHSSETSSMANEKESQWKATLDHTTVETPTNSSPRPTQIDISKENESNSPSCCPNTGDVNEGEKISSPLDIPDYLCPGRKKRNNDGGDCREVPDVTFSSNDCTDRARTQDDYPSK